MQKIVTLLFCRIQMRYDLSKIDQIEKNKKYIAFSQKMFMYKLNLQNINESNWIGSRIAKKKNIFFNAGFKKFKV